MCGVFGYIGSHSSKNSLQSAQVVLQGLKRLEYRGYDSWGVAVVEIENQHSSIAQNSKNSQTTQATINVKKRTGKIGKASVSDMPRSTVAIGHTRWATHGGVSLINAHPHMSNDQSVAIIHNGIVEKYQTLKEKLEKKGYCFVSETDSEVIAHLLSDSLKEDPSIKFVDAFRKTFTQLQGLNAVVAVQNQVNANQHQRIVAARNGSPLVVGFGEGEHFISSDPTALLPLTKKVFFLEDMQMADITAKGVKIIDIATQKEIAYKTKQLNWNSSQAEKGSYQHFMLKEVCEQPGILATIAASGKSDAKRLASQIQKVSDLFIIGCGSASYVCAVGSYLFADIAKKHVDWAVGSEFSHQLDCLQAKNAAILALSQSGETMDLLEPLKKAKQHNITVLALVNSQGSSLYRMANDTFLLGAGPEIAVASTKAVTSKIARLLLAAHELAGTFTTGQEDLEKASKSATEVLSENSLVGIQKVARRLRKAKHLFVIGRGVSFPASLEAALKIKEVSYIHAEGLASGELKHGALALVEQGVPCIVIAPDNKQYEDTIHAAAEVKARGGYIIGVSSKKDAIFDMHVPVLDAGTATLIPILIALQVVAYYVAVEKDLDPDMPRNLAKSVTVK